MNQQLAAFVLKGGRLIDPSTPRMICLPTWPPRARATPVANAPR